MAERWRAEPEPPHIGPLPTEPEAGDPAWEQDELGPRWVWRLIRVLVVLLVVAGSAGGWWYLHQHGGTLGGPVPLIRAESGATKIKPTDAGGEAVPYQDQTAYDMKAAGAAKVEHLLPPPEAPLPKPVPLAPAPDVTPPAPVLAQAVPPVPEPAPTRDAAPTPQPTVPAPKTVVATPPPPKPEPVAPAVKPPPPAQPVASTPPPPRPAPAGGAGEYRVQVAATRDEASGRVEFERMQRAHPDLLSGLSASISRADLGSRGIFWRVQSGPIPDKAKAEKLCTDLKAVSVGCSVVKP